MSKLNEIVKELTEQAKEEIKSVTISEDELKEFLDFQATFYDYSINNQLLIFKQRRSATAIMGFSQIKKNGLKLLKGSKSIKILAPIIYKEKDSKTGEEKSVVRGYKYVNVFDITQTDMKAEDYPRFFPNKPINFDTKKSDNEIDFLFSNILDLSKDLCLSIKIDTKDELNGARGSYNKATDVILLHNGNTKTQNIKTLIHELAHAELHNLKRKRSNDSKAIKETQAELVAYIVSKYFGIDTDDYSFKYIASWSEHLTAIDNKELIPVFNEIQQTAKIFISRISRKIERNKKIA